VLGYFLLPGINFLIWGPVASRDRFETMPPWPHWGCRGPNSRDSRLGWFLALGTRLMKDIGEAFSKLSAFLAVLMQR
jgi:hypothetical protein